jgi:hypothetical protein
LEIEVVSPVSQAVGDMIEAYLEENQMMLNHCSKVILAAQASRG